MILLGALSDRRKSRISFTQGKSSRLSSASDSVHWSSLESDWPPRRSMCTSKVVVLTLVALVFSDLKEVLTLGLVLKPSYIE